MPLETRIIAVATLNLLFLLRCTAMPGDSCNSKFDIMMLLAVPNTYHSSSEGKYAMIPVRRLMMMMMKRRYRKKEESSRECEDCDGPLLWYTNEHRGATERSKWKKYPNPLPAIFKLRIHHKRDGEYGIVVLTLCLRYVISACIVPPSGVLLKGTIVL